MKGSRVVKIKYFSDTDTALVEFSAGAVAETKEIKEKRSNVVL
jgi:uncharacterized protein YuzE